MDFDFAPEQETLRATVRELCSRHAAFDTLRRLENDPIGYSAEFWQQLATTGLTGLMVPERWGGSGMSMLDSVIVYEEFGRALAASPHFVSCMLGASLLLRAGSDEQRERWLPQISSGQAIFTPAWLDPDRGYGPEGIQLRARPDGSDWILSGVKRHVLFASSANRLVVLARVANSADDGIVILLVDPQADGVTLTQQHSLAADTQYRVDFDQVRVASDDVIGTPGAGWPIWRDVMQEAIILLAAQAVGGSRRALELAVDYAKTRHQFGKPLGAFQALAHYLADRVTEVDGAQVLVWEAAWARDNGRSIEQLAPMAKLFACQTFRDVTATAQQVFGGNGFTVEYDIQLFFRRAKQLQMSFWDNRYLEEAIADAVIAPTALRPGRG